jgi:hypothetical protein
MRNSLFPLVGVVLVAALAVLAIPRGTEVGQDGPQLSPGILRLPKDASKAVASATIAAENAVAVVTPPSRVPGLEPDAWRVVAVVAGDDHAVTRAAVLGLAERLTAAGEVAVIAEASKAPLPLAADRVLTITTDGEQLPEAPGGLCRATVHLRQEPVVLPAVHPAAGLQGATGVPMAEFRIAHASHGTGDAAHWANWFAAVGRSIGDQAIAALAGPAGLPGEWDRGRPAPIRPEAGSWTIRQPRALLFLLVVPVFLVARLLALRRLRPDHRQRTYRWRWLRPTVISLALVAGAVWTARPARLTPQESAPDVLATWTSHLPIAPSMEVLRWRGCFADDLVRGWVGRIGGTVAIDRGGVEIPADKPVLDWLGKYEEKPGKEDPARWHREPPVDGEPRIWRHEKDHAEELFMLARDARGFDCVLWQEQTQAASVHARWLDAADDPALARPARRLLRRHLLSPRIPDDQRADAAAILRRDPDAAEVAMLAELPDASAGEKAFAQAARYAYGREEAPPAVEEPRWTRLAKGAEVHFDGRPTLVQAGEVYALVLPRPDGGGELVARSPAGEARTALAADGTVSLALPGGGTLAVAAGDLITWR